ncbi:MAG TPA: amino acid adenylation domain-containing protein, partial [Blastocatellia bacterium]
MVPAAFVLLDQMPLTPNGKIDRNRLPDPSFTSSAAEFAHPRNHIEQMLAAIWTDLLPVDAVSINDNFFELGGHSLLATQLVARIQMQMGASLGLKQVFDSPTLAAMAEAVGQQLAASGVEEASPIRAVSREGGLPLSFSQQRLWFLHQLEAGSSAYNMTVAMRLRGRLGLAALEETFNRIVERHEILRTSFSSEGGMARQVVHAEMRVKLEEEDVSGRSEREQESYIEEMVKEETRRSFDLRELPLMRVRVVKRSEEERVMVINMHHIITDGWSMGVLGREIGEVYGSVVEGREAKVEELGVQYGDYAAWQREELRGERLERELRYWKEQLEGAATVIELPTDKPRPAAQTYTGAKQKAVIDKEVSKQLKSLCKQQDVTLFMSLLAAFNVVLQRYSGQEDILVGTPVANRNRVEIEGLIGFFVNTLVMRTDLSGEPSFAQLLARVRETALSAYAHQDAPFEKLVEELHPERDLGRTPIFQVMFNLLSFEDQKLELPGLTLAMMSAPDAASKFDLTLYAKEAGDQIHLELVYNAGLFSSSRMAEMLSQFNQLLAQIVQKPDEKISSYSLLTRKSQLLLPNPVQKIPARWDGSIIERFTKQAERFAKQVAVSDKTGAWAYEELDALSNQLANYLLATGIEREEVVAIYGGRDRSLVLALLGALKAGAAFVILDPAYPDLRLINCVEQAAPRAFITCETSGAVPQSLEGTLSSLNLRCRVALEDMSAFDSFSRKNPEIAIGPDDKTYIAFTSGSTGVPKGIIGIHRPLSHFIDWHTRMFKLVESDRFSMLSGLSHDPLLRDVFTPLWVGASLRIPGQEDMNSSDQLSRWMQKEEITIAHLTPAMGQLLTGVAMADANHSSEALSSLRCVFYGGDVLRASDISRLRSLGAAATCVNFYGATETPQAMGYKVIPRQTGDANQQQTAYQKDLSPVGKGIDGVQLLVINKAGRLAGVGELGEIHIRTPYLTRGYLGNEQLTQERFITNPFTGDSNDKLYRTGDLGRYLPDGNVEFAGRSDRQVKVRGFRVELSEIEAAICQHPAVSESVVEARINESGEGQLVGYVVAQQELSGGELRKHLKGRLPEYMVPAAFVLLDQMPLTPNGKIDR